MHDERSKFLQSGGVQSTAPAAVDFGIFLVRKKRSFNIT